MKLIDQVFLKVGLNFLCLFLLIFIFDLVETTIKKSGISKRLLNLIQVVIILLFYIIPVDISVDFNAKLFPTYENLFPTYENFITQCIFYYQLKSFDFIELTLKKIARILLFYIILAIVLYCFDLIQYNWTNLNITL
tara:strand:- start:113 stop:523 length:411 start_codon:yes stop_codon:yes gene_type:complete